ncbi:hypothetical protein RINTHM_2180 [Richelia intracellularis HM01]|uniref:hypothetical protein n=1 Tax=Richelia intracellularis TaxID=1164990 RepID=UPI0002B55EB0|nr:hypothetical protein [Richelia intracellularis]CCH64697.1 hypothetical protein RINTHM_2180 [Richelia intracellularis HM01]
MVSHLHRISIIIVKYFLLLYAVLGESGNYQDNSTIAIRMTSDFTVIYKSSGLKVYRRKTLDNQLEFVTVINTNQAKVKHLAGNFSKSSHNKIYKKSLTEFWQDEKKIDDNAQQLKVITNGTYFSTKKNPTGIAFGLKTPGRQPIMAMVLVKNILGKYAHFPGIIKLL